MTPDEVAGRAMERLTAEVARLACRVPVLPAFAPVFTADEFPCEECANCVERMPLMLEYHRLASLYPDAVPTNAPKDVRRAVKLARWVRAVP